MIKLLWKNTALRWLWRKKWWVIGFIAFLLFFIYGLPIFLTFLLDHNIYISNSNNAADYIKTVTENINPMDKFGLYGDSYGIWNAFFSALAFGGVIVSLIQQNKETSKRSLIEQYYKMLDFQQTLIDDMAVLPVSKNQRNTATIKNRSTVEFRIMEEASVVKGRKVFVEYKIQLKYLMRVVNEISIENKLNLSEMDVADIAYAVFYYGAEKEWESFMLEYLKDYEQKELLVKEILAKIAKDKKYALGRTNQNYMSVYSRNMYNAIKLIDQTSLLTEEEKVRYVKVLRAQLSNAELYVLFFNLLSRFGKKWNDNNYVVKYQLIQNLPSKYCDGYTPKDYYSEVKFEDEDLSRSPFKDKIVQR